MIDPKRLSETAALVFADEFSTLQLWDGGNGWDTKYPAAPEHGSTLDGNLEQEWYINHLYAPTASIRPWSASGGVLTLRAEKAAKPILTGPLQPYLYTSGMISSFHQFSTVYGYFEMRAQLPKGQGFWPAFWLLPVSMAWPPEIDVMEVLGNDTTILHNAAHTKQSGTHTSSGHQTKVPDLSLGFHTYGLDWQKDFIRWFFDGSEIFRVSTPTDIHEPMYLIANLALGGSWGGPVSAATPFPGLMKIDYIRAYKEITAPVPSSLEARVAELERWRKS